MVPAVRFVLAPDMVAPRTRRWGADDLEWVDVDLIASRRSEQATERTRTRPNSKDHQRQARLGGAIVIGLTILIIVFASIAGGRKTPDSRATAADLTAVTTPRTAPAAVDPSQRVWYQAMAGVRSGVQRTAATVRRYVATQDGLGLRPACAFLGAATTAARAHPAAPTASIDLLFNQGIEDYAGAAVWCSRLFDGTRLPVTTLQGNVINSLTRGDEQWNALARQLNVPADQPTPPGRGGADAAQPATAAPAPPVS
jgi:hypothetical protein